jgi:hypothetical protein
MMLRPTWAGAAIAVAACVTIRIDPAVVNAKRIALVAFYGPAVVAGISEGFSANNTRGFDVAADLVREVVPRLKQGLGVEVIPTERVAAAPSYASLQVVGSDDEYASLPGLRPLRLEERDAALGELAEELDVDAVLLMRNYWSLRGDVWPYGHNAVRIVIVGRNGRRLWDEEIFHDSAHSGSLEVHEPRAELPTTGNPALDWVREAVVRCVNHFTDAWNERRASAAPRL